MLYSVKVRTLAMKNTADINISSLSTLVKSNSGNFDVISCEPKDVKSGKSIGLN